jgi:3-hydroxymyristoyl/3-hydroxydecanoyl-(acyl carrier protein) dehydratase/malonyl CoA-acyl carrier protein transacylase/1-acyl-sn-glycerol-3-phosphate acyltransferase
MKASTDWLYGPGGAPAHPLDQLWGTSYLCQLHAELSRRVLRIAPNATIGYSSGESNALFAMGAWNDLDAMIRESRRSAIFTRDLVGAFDAPRRAWARMGASGTTWVNYSVAASVDEVRAVLAGEPLVHLTIVNAEGDCVIGGERAACERVVDKLGRDRVLPLGYEMAAHCPEVEEIRDAWWKMHHRETRDVPGVRFYTTATGSSYRPTAEAAADAITAQALRTVDFPKVIQQAYADGVRVFLEHGPRGLCSGWIRRILGERDHLAVPLDVAGRSGVRQAMNAVAWLVAAGVPVDARALEAKLAAAAPDARPAGPTLTLPAHPPLPRLPELGDVMQVMPRAPKLPPVLSEVPAAAQVVASATSPVVAALGRLAAQKAQLGAMHREFIARQAEVHQRFLALRQSTEAMLLRAYAGAAHALPPSPPPAALLSPPPAHVALRAATAPAAHDLAAVTARALPGPKFDRAQLEILAGGRISSVFGERFAAQDRYLRQVRMPEPPLLLADRVTGIDAVPGSMGTGTLWTETDVRHDSWYLNDEGRMPAGIMIEAGQADLLLISWLGVDLLNRGERVYRLLGCELTYHGSLPSPGDTLVYDIHVDGHAQQGDVRLFFFHYDCRIGGQPRLTVRHGQAGFFTDEELANSAGVLWECAAEQPGVGTVDPPAVECTKRRLDRGALRAFADGRPWDCFGPGWEATRAHVRTPRITAGRMLFLEEVTELDPRGGPWGRGYLRAESKVRPDDWFFAGHFKNDPCMPGTLMFEGCLQAMAVYLAGLGHTIDRDGWRFEPVPEEKYVMRCRGQVTPASQHLVYEVFVSEVSAGPLPTVFADLLCTVDGRKAFHAKRVGLRLVPDWPLEHWKALGPATTQKTGAPLALSTLGGLRDWIEPKPVASVDGFAFDYPSLLACAWGRPSAAFGPFYRVFDGPRRVARLPGPPYHFMSRVTQIDAPMGGMKPGSAIEVEYDVPAEQWYFAENGHLAMPFCVMMEAALQPCGWLASYVGSAQTTETDLLFRNLDGTGTLFQEILPTSGTLRTRVKLESVSRTAGMIIQSFAVECFLGEARVYAMNTVFGFFPKEAFENQVGLPVTDEERARLEAPSDFFVDLKARPPRYCGGELRLPGPMLLMLDRVTGYWPAGGRAGLGYLRAEKSVDSSEWFFKAHFFQDPVQPGSLGVDAMCQLLQFAMLERGMGEGVAHPRFEPVMLERPVTWKYRGQVVPQNRTITTELEITEIGEDARGRYAVAEAWLWVDGKRIYHAKNLGMRIVAGAAPRKGALEGAFAEELLDPAKDTWLADHCPTWTLPALPMMSMVDRLVAAAAAHAGRAVTGLRDVKVHRWLPFPGGPIALRTEVGGEGDERAVTLLAWREAADARLSRFEPVATATALLDEQDAPPSPFAPLADLRPVPDPYERGSLFHGPAFQYLTELRMGHTGATGTLRAERGSVPRGTLHQGLLDAATHAIPHDDLSAWCAEIAAGHVAYPYRLPWVRFFAPLPDSGDVRVEARFAGFDGDPRFPQIDLQLLHGERVLVALRLVEVLLPKGPLGAGPPEQRRAFLRDRRFVPGVALSTFDGSTTRLDETTVRQSDWLPGTVARIYRVPPGGELLAEIAVREHAARRAFVHPSTVTPEADGSGARAATRPLRLHRLHTERSASAIAVTDAGPPVQDLAPVRAYWRERLAIGPWPVEDLYYGLVERFVGDVVLADPEAFARVRGRSCLYLGNHQVGIESLLFSVLVSALSATPTVTLAKAEHRTSWLGRLIAHSFAYPGVSDPRLITFFDREDRESLLAIVGEIATEMKTRVKSAMVHVEGTRSLAARQPVIKMSSAFIDMALAVGAPIVPVRFVGGLPVEPLTTRIEFPLGYGKQDYWIGRPILPEELAALPYKDRKAHVIAAINALGPELARETPMAPDPAFSAAVAAWKASTGATAEDAVLYTTLAKLERPGDEVRALLEGARTGRLVVGADARGQWLGRLAERLFGPRGPAVEGLR